MSESKAPFIKIENVWFSYDGDEEGEHLPPVLKDVSLEILRLLSVKGGVGYIIEWGGEGIKTLSVPERATITNMGT